MLTDLKSYPYKLLPKYPGMRLADEVIWDEFIKKNPDSFLGCWYNVPLGDPFPEEAAKEEAVQNGGYDVSQWRIDVVAKTKDTWVVIELKPNAGPGSLGQALTYSKLLEKEWGLTQPVIPVVITDSLSPILEQAAALLKVQVLIA